MVDNQRKGGGGYQSGAVDIANINDHNNIIIPRPAVRLLVWTKEGQRPGDLRVPKAGMHNKLEFKDKHACMLLDRPIGHKHLPIGKSHTSS